MPEKREQELTQNYKWRFDNVWFGFCDGNTCRWTGCRWWAVCLMNLVPLIFMFAIFYFLLIRPQQKKAKEHRTLLDSLKKGDQVITAGGMHGKVTAIDENVVT